MGEGEGEARRAQAQLCGRDARAPRGANLPAQTLDGRRRNRPRNGWRKMRPEILIHLGNHSAPTQELPPMTRIRFIPAQVKTFPDERPDACKYCGSQIFTQRGAVEKSIIDLYEGKVTVVRYRRSDCGSAFRHCPEGVDRGGQTQRMRGWAALAWALGPVATLREPPAAAFSVSISRMSARRDVQEAGRNAGGKQAEGARGRDDGSREGRERGRGRSHGR